MTGYYIETNLAGTKEENNNNEADEKVVYKCSKNRVALINKI